MTAKNKLKPSKEVERIFFGTEIWHLIEKFYAQIRLIMKDVSELDNKIDKVKI